MLQSKEAFRRNTYLSGAILAGRVRDVLIESPHIVQEWDMRSALYNDFCEIFAADEEYEESDRDFHWAKKLFKEYFLDLSTKPEIWEYHAGENNCKSWGDVYDYFEYNRRWREGWRREILEDPRDPITNQIKGNVNFNFTSVQFSSKTNTTTPIPLETMKFDPKLKKRKLFEPLKEWRPNVYARVGWNWKYIDLLMSKHVFYDIKGNSSEIVFDNLSGKEQESSVQEAKKMFDEFLGTDNVVTVHSIQGVSCHINIVPLS